MTPVGDKCMWTLVRPDGTPSPADCWATVYRFATTPTTQIALPARNRKLQSFDRATSLFPTS
jgi:hypothetical protein